MKKPNMPSCKECDSKQFSNKANGVCTADKVWSRYNMGHFLKILQQISMDRPWGRAVGYLDGSMQNCSNSSALAVLRSAIDLFCI